MGGALDRGLPSGHHVKDVDVVYNLPATYKKPLRNEDQRATGDRCVAVACGRAGKD